MIYVLNLCSDFKFNQEEFFGLLSDCDIKVVSSFVSEEVLDFYFYRESYSHTYFKLSVWKRKFELYIDSLASVEDHCFFPYLVDTLADYIGIPFTKDEPSPFQIFDENWMEEHIADGIAQLKCSLLVSSHYYFSTKENRTAVLSVDSLSKYGVSIYSSTPRIYNYICYMLRNNKVELKYDSLSFLSDFETERDIEVDVPQHISIAKVKSWQTDGTETYDSFSKEDVELLLRLAENYKNGEFVEPVVLNDIGTIFQEGVGVEKDGEKAVYWFNQAILGGERCYAPVNLGDIYRKGCGNVEISLRKAFDAFLLSEDPYAYYRIGQAYEEGWLGDVNLTLAMEWYEKSASQGHHLALKRLKAT